MTSSKERLPAHIYPTHYDVSIKTDLAAESYTAEAAITLCIEKGDSSISFNVDPSLTITHIAIKTDKLHTLDPSNLDIDTTWQVATIPMSVAPGEATLFLRWEAQLGGNMNGYYKSVGTAKENGKKPVYALTQFEPTSARRALPCWDEPAMKATFAISMVAREGEVVLSNMSSDTTEPWHPGNVAFASDQWSPGDTLGGHSDGWVVTRFMTTPKMSTYLLAFACGEFEYLESKHTSALSGKTIPLRVYASNDIDQAQLGLDVMRWALPIYEELFEIEYPLPKLDTLVAHDFDMGAMENWGLITGRTTAYFCNERSSLAARKRIGQVQCHEVAHMWFGNIVTMGWWDNLWLNEAFATLMGSIVLPDRIWPEWKMGTQFIDDHLIRALSLDSRRSSHPIEVACANASEINQIFDAISYSKGASVLRMLRSVVGDDRFFKGVAIYLKKHLYGNAQTSDLWEGISEAVGPELDVGKVMANWTLKIGFPVITVEEGEGSLTLTQNRFLSTGDVKAEEDETLWWVPLEIKTIENGKATTDHKAVLSTRKETFPIASDTFKLNAQMVGVYRVKYTPERLVKLGQQAQQFSLEDRMGILSDATALAAAGYSSTAGALSLAKELAKDETEYLPFSGISSLVGAVAAVWWENDPIRTAVDALRVQLYLPVIDKMGYDQGPDDTPEMKQLRALAISVASSAGNEDVIDELKKRFAKFMESGDDSGIAPELQRTIFRTAVKNGGAAEYDVVFKLYTNPPNPSTKMDAVAALCAAQEPALLDKTFAMLDDPAVVKDQDMAIFFMDLAANRACRHRAAQYLMDNWEKLNERFSASFGLRHGIAGVFGALSSSADLARVKAFFAEKETKYKNVVAQAIEGMEGRAKWLERDEADLVQWLNANGLTVQ